MMKKRGLHQSGKGLKQIRVRVTAALTMVTLTAGMVLANLAPLTAQAKARSKEEMVSIKADADGTVYRVTSENVLSGVERDKEIRDYSTLTEIRNISGDEEYTIRPDGTIVWDNHGEEIRYDGTGDSDDLPVEVQISYYLNGKQKTAAEIAGASGTVKIRFDYINHTEPYVPFAFVTMLLLDDDVFSGVEVENGAATTFDSYKLVYGYAMPGLKETLHLARLDATKDMDIPEYVEITADAEEFALDFTVTMVMNGLFRDLDTEDLTDLEDLAEGMEEISEASGKLVDGLESLYGGMGTYRSALKTYTDGVSQVHTGVTQFEEGMRTLTDNTAALTDGASQLASGLSQLDQALSGIDLSAMSGGGIDTSAITKAAQGLTTYGAQLQNGLTTLQTALSALGSLQTGMQTIAADVQTIGEKAQEIGTQLANIGGAAGSIGGAVQSINDAADRIGGAAATLDDTTAAAQKSSITTDVSLIKGAAGTIDGAADTINAAFTAQQAALAAQSAAVTEAATILQSLGSLDLSAVNGASTEIASALKGLSDSMTALQTALTALSSLGTQFSGLTGQLSQLQSGVHQLAEGSAQLSAGVSAFCDGVVQASDGVTALADGTRQLSGASPQLLSGFDTIRNGTGKLLDGMRTFDDEAIGKLTEMADEGLEDVIHALRDVQEADAGYRTFSGAAAGYETDVKFIIETDEVRMSH